MSLGSLGSLSLSLGVPPLMRGVWALLLSPDPQQTPSQHGEIFHPIVAQSLRFEGMEGFRRPRNRFSECIRGWGVMFYLKGY